MEDFKKFVASMNDELPKMDKYYESCDSFSYNTCGHCESISFGGKTLWDSDDDGYFNGVMGMSEELEKFVRTNFNDYIDKISYYVLSE